MKELSGTTLRVYLHILKKGKERVGVRELMRELNMKSPSHAYYHLDKLVSLGLLRKEHGEYYLNKDVKVDYLKDYVFLGSKLVPRFFLYTLLFLTILVFSLALPRLDELYWYVTLLLSTVGFLVSLYESASSIKKLR